MSYAVGHLPIFAYAACLSGTVWASTPLDTFVPERNPFSRPQATSSSPDPMNFSAQTSTLPVASEWQPSLRAVMLGGRKPVINVDGKTLSIGDSIDGYRLTAVREREAVFVRNGRHIILSIDARDAR